MSEIFESKWSETKTALTEGLAGNKKKTMDVVLENTKRYLSESATAGATSAGNVATLNRVILPVIRRVMPTVIANEIVGVQPMTGPVGQIHTLRIRYADTSSGTTSTVPDLRAQCGFVPQVGSGGREGSGEGWRGWGSGLGLRNVAFSFIWNPRKGFLARLDISAPPPR